MGWFLRKIHGCYYDIASSGKIDGQMLFECVFPRFYWLILHFFRMKIGQCENHSELLLLSNTLRSHLGRWQFFGLALYSTSMYYGKTRSKSICPSILPLPTGCNIIMTCMDFTQKSAHCQLNKLNAALLAWVPLPLLFSEIPLRCVFFLHFCGQKNCLGSHLQCSYFKRIFSSTT